MRVRGTLEYLGTKWSGWQWQPDAPTIQGELERALEILTRREQRISAAGRTDAGVHASGQIISFLVDDETDLSRMLRSLNALTDPTITIVDLVKCDERFDPRRSAVSRSYEYRIVNHRPPSPFLADRSWHLHQPLDFELLQRLASKILGKRDFTAFRAADCASNSVHREVYESAWHKDGSILAYRVTANAFLKQMVRTLVGSMVDVALGRLGEDRFAALLEGGTRDSAGATAPAAGLTLVHVEYPDDALRIPD